MTAQETNLFNAFETTLATTMGSSDTTLTVAAVTDSYPTTLSAPFYIVINPDSATNREVILVTAVNTGTKELTTSVLNRYLPGSAASSGLSHSSGQVVRMAPLQQHIEDINDRVNTIINEDGTAVNTSLFLDEDDMVSDSATKGVTQQSVKAYVDSQVTAQDLDFLGDSGSGAVDLDSQEFTIAGTADEIETSASGQTITIGLPSTITTTLSATSVLSDGVVATTQTASDNSTKVATTAYVDAQVTAEDLDFGGDTGTGSVDLDSQTFTIAGTANEIETSATGQTLTVGLPSSITVDVVGNLTGNVTGNVTGNLTGDTTGNVTATSVLADGVTATTQSAGDNSTKVATTAYVDAVSVDDNLTVGNGTSTTTIDLDTQTLSILGTANEIDVGVSAQTLTLSLPSSITVNVTGQVSDISNHSTSDLSEGTNLYYTDARVQAVSIDNVVEDTTPQLGGNLDLNSNNITGTGDISITGDTTLTSTDAGSSSSPTINLYRNSASPAGADYIGELDFQGESSTGATRSYAQIKGKIADPTNTTEDGTLEIWIRNNGSNDVTARFNENGLLLTEDMTLKFEGDTNDGNETTLTVTDPTADRTVTLPDASGTVILDSSSVGDLSDVDTTGVTNGQVLSYNSTSGDFEPADPTTGDITAVNTNANSGLAGGAVSGDVDLTVDPSNLADGTSITVDTSNDLLILEDAGGTVYKVNPDQIASGSANALIDGTSDLTITDGTGLDYDISGTDVASWEVGGIALTADGGIFRHNQTQAATYTVAATEGAVLAGPITITGTVTNAGTMVIL